MKKFSPYMAVLFAVGVICALGASLKVGTGDNIVVDLIQPSANVLSLYNSTTPQRISVFGTRTDAGNYRRGYVTDSTGGVTAIGSEGLGSGATGNSLEFYTDGTLRLTLPNNGVNSFTGSLIVSGAITAGSNLNFANTGYLQTPGRCSLSTPADGIWLLMNNGASGFDRLDFGGITSSFPSWQRSGTSLRARLADDSANTTVTATGLVDTSTATSVAISATGWTNSFGIHSTVFIEGVAMTFVVYNNAGTAAYTNSATVANATIPLQAAGKVIVTAGTGVSGVAVPW